MKKSIPIQLEKRKKSRWKRTLLWILVGFIGLLIIARIALPFFILHKINKKLEILPNYICVVKDFSLNLMKQSLTLKGIEMTKRNGKIKTPFFVSGDIHVSLESYEDRTSKIVVEDCILNLVRGKNKEESQLSIDKELMEIFKLMPLQPNIFIVKKADIHFIETYREADIDLSVKNIKIDGRNIENQSKSTEKFPATLVISGDFEGGKLKADVALNKQKKDPLVRIVSYFTPIEVSRVKDFLKVYADLKVDSGTLSATCEINIYNGRMDGFIDPVAKELVFSQHENKKDVKLLQKIKKPILNALSNMIGQGKDKEIKTRIELHGTMGEVKVDVWEIISKGLKESFQSGEKKN